MKLLLISMLCIGCGATDDDDIFTTTDAMSAATTDAATDAATIACEQATATFGRCIVEGTGADCTDTVTAQNLYLTLSGPTAEIAGITLTGAAAITDRDGAEKCGSTSFAAAAGS